MLIVSSLVAFFLINYYAIDFVLKYVTIVGIFFGILMSLYGLYNGGKEKRMKYEIIQKLPDYLNAQGIENLLIAASNDPSGNSLMVKLTWQCGLGLSAVLNLRVEDIDFGNKKIKIVQPKGNKDKYVPITTVLIMEIQYYLMVQNIEAGYIFHQERSKLLQEGAHN